MANLVLPQGAEIIGDISTPTLERVYGPEGARQQRQLTANRQGYLGEGLPFSEPFAAGVGAVADWLFGGDRASISDVPSLYRERLALEYQGTDAFRAENPVTSVLANVGAAASAAPKAAAQAATTLGGRALNTALGTAPTAATIPGRIGQGVAAGATGGALAGYDEQRGGGLVPDLEQVGTAAALGAGIGGGIAVLAPFVESVAAGIRNITGLQGAGAERRAQQMVIRALEADGVPLDRITELERRGKPLTLADVEALTGKPATNTRTLFGNAARMGGDEGRRYASFLDERSVGTRADATGAPAGGAVDRMSDDVRRAFRISGETARQADARIIQQRADVARPFYQALEREVVEVQGDLLNVLQASPSARAALRRSLNVYADSGGQVPPAWRKFADTGEVPDGGIVMPFRILDQTKKELDELAFKAKAPTSGADIGSVTGIRNARGRLVAAMDEALPDYAAARAASAGPAADLEALRAGQKFARMDSDEVAESLADMLPEQRDLFRLGAAQEILRKVRGTVDGGDASKLFQNENMRDRLREVFPDEDTFNRFVRAASDERVMQQTRNKVIEGSQTATRQTADQSAVGEALGSAALDIVGGGGAVTASTGGRIGAGLLRRGGERIMQGTNEAVFGEIARMGQRTDPSAVVGAAQRGGRNIPATIGTIRGTVQAPGAIAAAAATEPAAIRAASFGASVDRTPGQQLPPLQPATQRLMLPQGAEIVGDTTRQQMRAAPRANIADLDAGVKSKWLDVQADFGVPLTVISAHRTPEYNKAVRGASKSQHLKGKAIDVDVSGLSEAQKLELIRKASDAGFYGIGIYGNSLHFDTGPRRVWGPSYKRGSVPKWARREVARHMNKGEF